MTAKDQLYYAVIDNTPYTNFLERTNVEEIWSHVPGYYANYEVSNYLRVRLGTRILKEYEGSMRFSKLGNYGFYVKLRINRINDRPVYIKRYIFNMLYHKHINDFIFSQV